MASDDPTSDTIRAARGGQPAPDTAPPAADGEAPAPVDTAPTETPPVDTAPADAALPDAAAAARADTVVEPDAYEAPDVAEPLVLAQRPSPFVPLIAGAVAGGLVAVAAAWTFTQYVPPPGQSSAAGQVAALAADISRDRAVDAQRFDKLEAMLRQQAAPDLQPITGGLAQVRDSVAQVRDGLAQTRDGLAKANADIAALRSQLQAGVDSVKAQAGDVGRKVDETQKRIEELSASALALDRAAAAVAVLAVLRDAVLSGRPFAMELDAARAILGPSAGSFDPFVAAANSGYAPPAKLAARLAEDGAAALSAEPGAPRADGLVNRLMSSAENLVRVTPPGGTGAAASPDAAAALQKAVAAVRAGDMDAALAALATLPPGAREKLQPLVAEIEGRRDAANAAATLFQQALAAISGKVP
ncbi:COG4223 family protein [Azorhizobium doebereinerae]|uniref:COG4223 family protein n=1 Tax=Azorhizobium doebereinerae TaxID=281091 RepID=UPI00040E8444|nr:hypothetical protein [Azorhizobium doebereinerae]